MDPVINTAHVVNGALVLGTSLVLTLRALRAGFARPSGLRRFAGSRSDRSKVSRYDGRGPAMSVRSDAAVIAGVARADA